MNIIENIFSPDIVNALGWAVIHSFWQGFLIALLTASALLFMHKKSSRLRYAVTSIAMLIIFFAFIAKFFFEFNKTDITNVPESKINQVAFVGERDITEENPDSSLFLVLENIIKDFGAYFSRNITAITTLWLTGILFLLLKLIGGAVYTRRIKYHKTEFVPLILHIG